MQRIDELLKDLGFKKDAPVSTQMAFLKHLSRELSSIPHAPIQLEFDSAILGHQPKPNKTGSEK